MKSCYVTEPCANSNGSVLGSFWAEADDLGQVTACAVLSPEQIKKKHGLSHKEFDAMRDQIRRTKVSEALFNWPIDPRYDILLYLVASTR